MKNDGFLNEQNIKKHIHNKYLHEITPNLKENLILKIFENIDRKSKITCFKIGGQSKADIRINLKKNLALLV